MNRKTALVITIAATLMLAACWENPHSRQLIDVRPIGHGLEFLGMMGVLAALIIVLGKFVTESEVMKWKYVPHIMVALLIILALVVVAAAVPALIIPFSAAMVVAVVLAFAWHRWK
jgi:hypothetical protein